MTIGRAMLIGLILVASLVVSTSLVPFLPGSLKLLEPWLIVPFLLVPSRPRFALVLSLVLGWMASLYRSGEAGLSLAALPLSVGLATFIHLSWRTHRGWLRRLSFIALGTFFYHLLVIGFDSVIAPLANEDSSLTRAADAFRLLPGQLLLNTFLGITLARTIERVFLGRARPDSYAETHPAFD